MDQEVLTLESASLLADVEASFRICKLKGFLWHAITKVHWIIHRLWEKAAEKGIYLISNLEKFAAKYPQIYEKITGKGLLIGMHFKTPEIGYKVAAELFKRNVVVAGTLTSAQTIRVEPPLIVTQEQMDILLDRLGEVLKEIK